MNLDPYFKSYTQNVISEVYITDLNVKVDIIKILEENTKYTHDLK